jgi:hypothetical protein
MIGPLDQTVIDKKKNSLKSEPPQSALWDVIPVA